ncbi:MAG TPA: hypothetical protein DD671_17565 [Balneolaceae bacterium]|nr:hypothetical protein [Balneolaceae bacterium]
MHFPVQKPNITIIENEFSACAPSSLQSGLSVGDGDFQQVAKAAIEEGGQVTLSPSAEETGSWVWRGPGNFSSTEKEVTLENITPDMSGIYTVTFENSCGTTNRLSFVVDVLQNSWGFEDGTFQGWTINEDHGSVSLAKSTKYEGFYSAELTGSYGSDSVSLDFMDPLNKSGIKNGNWINFKVFIPEDKRSSISEVAIYHRHGNNWESEDHVWAETTFSIDELETDTWITLSGQLSQEFNSENLLVMGLLVRQPESTYPKIFIDNINFTDLRPTSNEIQDLNLPHQISLGQNFPNPFNPTTQIPFHLPKSETITIAVYNSMGQKVQDIVSNKTFPPGSHAVSFNGEGFSSGIYFYRLTTESFVETKKLNLIK